MYHHILYINIMVKVEMGKVEVQYLYWYGQLVGQPAVKH